MSVTQVFAGRNAKASAEQGQKPQQNIASLTDLSITPESEAAAVAAVREKRVNDAIAAAEGADPKSDRFALGSVYTACKKAQEDLAAERATLEATGHYTEEGIRKKLLPIAKGKVAHLRELNETVVSSRLTTINAKLNAIVAKSAAPLMEATDEDILLATNYAALPAKKQREYLRGALAGNDHKLARALALAHPLVADIHPDNRKVLLEKVTGRSSEEHVALESRKAKWRELNEHIAFTVETIGAVVEKID